jgi:hypothetical protein
MERRENPPGAFSLDGSTYIDYFWVCELAAPNAVVYGGESGVTRSDAELWILKRAEPGK